MTQKNEISVYNLSGGLVRSWSHTSNFDSFNKLRIVGGTVVEPDGTKKSLAVYSLDGERIKDIPCPNIRPGNCKALAVCGDNSVVTTGVDQYSE